MEGVTSYLTPKLKQCLTLCVLVIAIMLAGCSGKIQPTGAPGGTSAGASAGSLAQKNDTAAAADSSSQAAAAPPARPLTYEQRQGKFLYAKYCMVCHGEDGKGDGFNAFNLDPKPRDFTDARIMNSLTDEKLEQTISGGGRSVNKSMMMPSWGGRLSKEEIDYVIAYVRQFSPAK
jgi:mono/diheme cytochrome c family protein